MEVLKLSSSILPSVLPLPMRGALATLTPLVRFHTVVLSLCCFLLLRWIYLLFFHPLADLPGPKLAALTDFWKAYQVYNKRYLHALLELHSKHGDLVRIGPNEVSMVSPNDIPQIYGPRSSFRKGPSYRAWNVFGQGNFAVIDPAKHQEVRNAVAPAYSIQHLVTLERYCDNCTPELLCVLDKASRNEEYIDANVIFSGYAYDCISGIGFGKSLGLLSSLLQECAPTLNESMLMEMAEAHHKVFLWSSLVTWNWLPSTAPFSRIFSAISRNNGPELFLAYGKKCLHERCHLKETDPMTYHSESRRDMLYWFMNRGRHAISHGESLSPREILTNCLSLIIAGADTTAMSMISFVRFVYTNPSTLVRLREEIERVVSPNHGENFDAESLQSVTYAQACKLDFLWACMKEAMRLYPSIGAPLQRVVPEGGRVVGERFYRAGTLVGMLPYLIHNDSRAYGPDASKWRPERWLGDDRHVLERYNLVFGQGTRICLGKNISMLEMSKVLPLIVYYYDFEILGNDPGAEQECTKLGGVLDDVWELNESWFVKQKRFRCRIKRRKF